MVANTAAIHRSVIHTRDLDQFGAVRPVTTIKSGVYSIATPKTGQDRSRAPVCPRQLKEYFTERFPTIFERELDEQTVIGD
jgi:hypothetical protein